MRIVRAACLTAAMLTLAAGAAFAQETSPAGYEGFGAKTVGGAGGQVVWVDPALGDPNSDDRPGTKEQPCSLRKALSDGNRIVKFTTGGTITLHGEIRITHSCVTIDGASAPAPGITITHTQEKHGGISIASRDGDIHDFIISHLRFQGLWREFPGHKVGYRLLDVAATMGKVSNVVFDHLTLADLQDKTTFWGDVENVTVSWCLFYDSNKALLVSFYGHPFDLRRKGFSIHHNVFARNTERSPQLRGWIEDLELTNNIVYGWDFDEKDGSAYGTRVKNEPNEKPVNANIVNNVWQPLHGGGERALIYGFEPESVERDGGPSEAVKQGTVVTTSRMGKLWVTGNILPKENDKQYSTVNAPLAIPDWAKLSVSPADRLGETVAPRAGVKFRSEREKKLLDEVQHALSPQASSAPATQPLEQPASK